LPKKTDKFYSSRRIFLCKTHFVLEPMIG
jgi:hypothetical protein